MRNVKETRYNGAVRARRRVVRDEVREVMKRPECIGPYKVIGRISAFIVNP